MLKIIRSKETSYIAVVQDRSELYGDNLKSIRHEGSRHFRNRRRNIWKIQLMSLQRTVRAGNFEYV
jgi:hypothetical protein